MRRAEYVMAGVMAVFSLYLMWKSAELPIWWTPRKGPGGGAFPFWLSLGMLVCCGVIAWRNWRGATAESRSTEPFLDREGVKVFAVSAGSLLVMLLLSIWLGLYVALLLFLGFYIRVVGRHSWLTAGSIAIAAPIASFFFFEVGMKILLPKGVTEPLFYPLYGYFM